MLTMLFSSSYTAAEKMLMLGAIVFIVFCCLPVHEYAHAWTATKLGDDTARLSGRLTLNPMAHISWIGALMILLVGFGYAKPVPVNIRNFKNRKRDFAIVSVAGPISNLLMAWLFYFLCQFFGFMYTTVSPGSNVLYIAYIFFKFAGSINVSLAVFNLLPIPPLDGSRLLTLFVPDKYYYFLLQYERYIMIALFVLLWLGWLTVPLQFLSGYVNKFLLWITALPFKALS